MKDGIAPYNGSVAVTHNSRAITSLEAENDPHYHQILRECEEVARFLRTTAPIRVDVRLYKDSKNSPFALLDVNMKPLSTIIEAF